jgi:hypothetical protein
MKIFLFPLILMTSSVMAQTFMPVAGDYDFKGVPEFQAIVTLLRSKGQFQEKIAPSPKGQSKGEKLVEEAKARNRALLLAQRKNDDTTAPVKDGWDLAAIKREHAKTLKAWKADVQNQRKIWQKEQDLFLGRLKNYKENSFAMPVKAEKIVERPIQKETIPDVHIVNGAFAVPIRDQRDRPTCSAFAVSRALEILLIQNKIEQNLSEQYLYWASKPNCQNAPCSEKGSWAPNAIKFSKHRPVPDIPSEKSCQYRESNEHKNETQIPLAESCKEGRVKVLAYQEIKTLAEILEALKRHIPVVMAAKLSENFYLNQGLVTLEDAEKSSGTKLDAHAKGHAFTAIGILELPLELQQKEGSFCLLIANSWGQGWGAGGYGCLTERWLMKYRQPSPFAAVTQVAAK